VSQKKCLDLIPTKLTLATLPPTTNTLVWSLNKLTMCMTTIAMIQAHTEATFGKKLSTWMKKASLIVAYEQLATAPLTAPPAATSATPGPCHTSPNPHMSKWMVRRLPNMGVLGNPQPYGGDPLPLI